MKRILVATLALVFLSACPKSCQKKADEAAKPADSAAAPAAEGEKAAYIKAMDDGCAKAREEVKAFKPQPDSDGNVGYKALHDSFVSAKAVTDKLHEKKKKMPRPSADSADLDKYFSAMNELTTGMNAWIESLKEATEAPEDQKEAADHKVNEQMQKTGALVTALQEAATKYGFKVCGIAKLK